MTLLSASSSAHSSAWAGRGPCWSLSPPLWYLGSVASEQCRLQGFVLVWVLTNWGTENRAGFDPVTSHLTSYAAILPILGSENCAAFSTRLSFDLIANESNGIPKPTHLNLLLLRTLFTLSSVCMLYRNAGIVLNTVLKPKPAGQKINKLMNWATEM